MRQAFCDGPRFEILASRMAVIDGPVVSVALPALQSAIGATYRRLSMDCGGMRTSSGSITARRIILRHRPLVTMALVSRGRPLSAR
jgi:hypothetical protein